MRRRRLALLALVLLAACSRRKPPPPPAPAEDPAAAARAALADLAALPLAEDFEGTALFRSPGGEPRRVGDVEIRSAGPDPRTLDAAGFRASLLEGGRVEVVDARIDKGSVLARVRGTARRLADGRQRRWVTHGEAELAKAGTRWVLRRFRGTGARVEDGPVRFAEGEAPESGEPGLAMDVDGDGVLDRGPVGAWCAADVDNDGDLDACGGSVLWVNEGGGRFEARALDVERPVAAAFGDVDDDGDPDLAVSTDGGGVRLLRNRAGGFEAAGLWPPNQAGGLAWADADGDGRLDLLTAAGVLLNDGKGGLKAPLAAGPPGGRGVAVWDVDNDGRAHLLVTRAGGPDEFHFRTDRGYEEIGTGTAGADGGALRVLDLDGDGALDALVQRPDGWRALRNRAAAGNRWIRLQLRGRASNRFGIGARLLVNRRRVDLACEGGGPELHVGLGTAAAADVEVRWPCGQIDRHAGLEPGRLWLLTEGDDPE